MTARKLANALIFVVLFHLGLAKYDISVKGVPCLENGFSPDIVSITKIVIYAQNN